MAAVEKEVTGMKEVTMKRVLFGLSLASLVCGLAVVIMAWAWFGWKLALILLLLNFSINCHWTVRTRQ